MKLILKIPALVHFLLIYLKDMIRANLRVAQDALRPRHRMRPGIVDIRLESLSDLEILVLTNLITMTPGITCLDVSGDRRTIYVHAMFCEDRNQILREVKDDLEKRVLHLTR